MIGPVEPERFAVRPEGSVYAHGRDGADLTHPDFDVELYNAGAQVARAIASWEFENDGVPGGELYWTTDALLTELGYYRAALDRAFEQRDARELRDSE